MAIPFVQSIDMTDFQILNFVVHSAGSSPTNSGGAGGMMWWDSTNYALKIYNDNAAAWNPVPQAPTSTTDGYVPTWSGTLGAFLGTGYSVATTVGSPGVDTALVTEQGIREAIVTASTGIDVKESSRVNSDSTSTEGTGYSYNNTGGTSGRGQITWTSGPTTIDGVPLANDDRILNSETGAAGGIWVRTAQNTWDRATDFDEDDEVTANAYTWIEEGTTYADTAWVLTTNDPITIGGASGTSLSWTQYAGLGTYTAGEGLDLTSGAFSLDFPGLTNETTLADADEFAYYDATATAHRALTYSALKTALNTDLSFSTLDWGTATNNYIVYGSSPGDIESTSLLAYDDVLHTLTIDGGASDSGAVDIQYNAQTAIDIYGTSTLTGNVRAATSLFLNSAHATTPRIIVGNTGTNDALLSIRHTANTQTSIVEASTSSGTLAFDLREDGTLYIPALGSDDTEDHVLAIDDTTGLITKRSVSSISSGGAFTDLSDTPSSYTGTAGQFLQVNSTPDALVFVEDLVMNDTAYIRSGNAVADVLYLAAYDVDGAVETTFITLTSNNTPTCDLSTAVTVGGNTIVYDGGAFHDGFSDFVANEHINHTSVTITAGSGLSYSAGGTDISASATIDLDINELTGESAIVDADEFAFYDATATANRKITYAQLVTALEADLDTAGYATVVSGDLASGASPTITHNLNKTEITDLVVQIWRQSDNKLVSVELTAATADTVTVSFGSAAINPTLGTFRYVVTGVQE